MVAAHRIPTTISPTSAPTISRISRISRQPSTRAAGVMLGTLEKLYQALGQRATAPYLAAVDEAMRYRDWDGVYAALRGMREGRHGSDPLLTVADAACDVPTALSDAISRVRVMWRHGGRGWDDADRAHAVNLLDSAMAVTPLAIILLALAWRDMTACARVTDPEVA